MTGKRNKILILDGSSYIGGHLFDGLGVGRAVATYYRSPIENGTYFDSLSMDLSDVIQEPEKFSHAVVLIAIPGPDPCAADPAKSHALNVESIKRIIDYLNRWKIKPLFTSTESVFDGAKGNYEESDPPNPILTYGWQKVEIEDYLQRNCETSTIVRLAKVFGSERGDGTLFTSWLDAIERSETILCARDQIFSPIHVQDVVKGIIRLIELDCDGIYHLSNPKAYSRLQLLNILLDRVAERSPLGVKVVPCSIHDFDLLEKRPLNVSMNPGKLIKSTGIRINAVETVVQDIVTDTFSPVPAGGR
jgi:dTDP-4-dehydrorhamnose reductase